MTQTLDEFKGFVEVVSVELPLSVQLLGVTTKYEMDTKSSLGTQKMQEKSRRLDAEENRGGVWCTKGFILKNEARM